jgi:hypothetical protein
MESQRSFIDRGADFYQLIDRIGKNEKKQLKARVDETIIYEREMISSCSCSNKRTKFVGIKN